jgi:hypothetical protein
LAAGDLADVLHEIKGVKQERVPGRRRWFESDGLELVVWLAPDDEIDGFQLCYALGRGEHALTWRVDGGFVHSAVDAGDASPLKNETPILQPDGEVPWSELGRVFGERSAELEPQLRHFIAAKLESRDAADTSPR